MGIYNNIHDPNNDDNYYYCPVNDCPCHQHDYYDSSRNYNNVYFNYDNNDDSTKYNNDDKYDDYNVVNNDYYNNKFNSSSTR
jgi:hypothetical protein